jgi:arylsulfatase A-like enzyme
MPTLLEMTGQEIPANLQGRSLVPLIEGREENWRDAAFSEKGVLESTRVYTMRAEECRYVQYRDEPTGSIVFEQFFDLSTDPWEMNDQLLNPNYAERVQHLRRLFAAWEAETERAEPRPKSLSPLHSKSAVGKGS